MAKAKSLNPEGTLLSFGNDKVRLERGHDTPDRDSAMVWILFEREDVTDDPDTTYTYRFNEVGRFTEDEAGEPSAKALERAEALAGKGE
jgi:hypothetical protein